MTIRVRLLLSLAAAVIGVAATAGLCFVTIERLRIGSPLDRQIERAERRLARLALLDGLLAKARSTLVTLVYVRADGFDRSRHDELLRIHRDIDTVFAVILAHEDTLTPNPSNLGLQRAKVAYDAFATTRDNLIVPLLRAGRIREAEPVVFGEQMRRHETFSRLVALENQRAESEIVRTHALAAQTYRGAAWTTLALVVSVALGTGALCWRAMRATVVPLDRLMHFANGIALGQLDERAPISDSGDEFGKLARVLDAMLDRIAEQSRRVSLAFEAAPTGMLMIDATGHIVLANRRMKVDFGYAPDELVGQSVDVLVPPASRGAHGSHVTGYMADPSERRMGGDRSLSGRRRDGQLIPVEVGLTPLQTSQGLYVIAAITNIAVRRRQEQAIARSNEELERFAFVAAHDLREPARSVASLAEMLQSTQEQYLDERGRQILGFMVSSSERMLDLVDSLLEHSRIGRMSDIEVVDCGAAVRAVLRDLASAIEESRAQISVSPLPQITGRSLEIRLLFQNLIANAIKFRRDDARPEIQVCAVETESGVEFRVTDNGVGIRPDQRAKVFEIFQRAHGGAKYRGCGIGLAHCKKIVDLHDGEIALGDSDQGGTEVRFVIPRTAPPVAPDAPKGCELGGGGVA